MPRRCPKRRAPSGPSMRRRVHSPSCAISTTVVSVTVVRGSMNASTPRRERTNCQGAPDRHDWLGGLRTARLAPPPKPGHRRSSSRIRRRRARVVRGCGQGYVQNRCPWHLTSPRPSTSDKMAPATKRPYHAFESVAEGDHGERPDL
jgi:hypothetical protein